MTTLISKCQRASAILALLLSSFLADVPTARGAKDDTQQWTTATVAHKIDNHFTLSLASRIRFDDNVSRAKDLMFRPAVKVAVLPPFSMGLGYDYVYSYAANSSTEHRIWEQAGLKIDLDDLSIGNRLRVEERFIEGVSGVVVRARFRLRLAHPLGDSDWQVIGSNEVFVNLSNRGAGPVSGFEQNRLFGGLGRTLWNDVRFEFGYQWGYEEQRTEENLVTHSLLVNITYDF